MQSEKQALTSNYKELEALFKQLEQEKSIEGLEMGGKNSLQDRVSIEREAIRIEIDSLKDEKRNLQGDIKNLQTFIDELTNQLGNNKEFVNNLGIERDELHKKLHKLREEIKATAQRKDSSSKRSSLAAMQTISPIKEDFISAFDDQSEDFSAFRREIPKKSSFMKSDSPRRKVLIAALEQTVLQTKGHVRTASDSTFMKKSTNEDFYLNLIKEEDEKTIDEKSVTNRSNDTRQKENINQTDPTFSKLNESSLLLIKNDSSISGQKILHPESLENSSAKAKMEAASKKDTLVSQFNKDSPEIKRKPSFLELLAVVEKKKTKLDYLNYYTKPPVVKLLTSNDEDLKEGIIYTDNIYIITEKESREQNVLLITGKNLYCLSPNKSYKVIRKIPLAQIYRISISQTSAGLCAFHIHKE